MNDIEKAIKKVLDKYLLKEMVVGMGGDRDGFCIVCGYPMRPEYQLQGIDEMVNAIMEELREGIKKEPGDTIKISEVFGE